MGKSMFLVTGIFLALNLLGSGYSIEQYNIFYKCNKDISLISEDIHDVLLYYEHDFRLFKDSFDCTLEIWGYFRGSGLAIQVTLFNMSSTKTFVEIRQGDSWEKSWGIEGLPEKMSSDTFNETNKVFVSDWEDIFIRVSGEWPPIGERIFELVVNHYHTGICESWEVACDNGRCIHEDIKCNGYNPCGDFSDCKDTDGMTSGMITVICVCAITGSACILTIIYQLIKYQWKKRRRRQESEPEICAQPSLGCDDESDEVLRPYGNIIRANNARNDATEPRDMTDGDTSPYTRRRLNDDDDADTNQGPPTYNDVTSPRVTYSSLDNGRDNNGHAVPDANTALLWDNSSNGTIVQPSAPSGTNFEPSAPNQQMLDGNTLPSYFDVLENEDAYQVTSGV